MGLSSDQEADFGSASPNAVFGLPIQGKGLMFPG